MSAPPRALPPTAGGPLTVGVIGAGRVGAVLGAALRAAGHQIVAVSARFPASRARAAALLPTVPVRPVGEVAAAGTRLLLVAVPDDALPGVIAQIAGRIREGQVVAHTSGAHGLGVLAPASLRGAVPLALHPAMTFTGTGSDLERLPGTSYGITAPRTLRPLVTRLVADLGGTPEWVDDPARVLYHAALAHGANHLTTLVTEAADRLRDAGVQEPARVLAPLLRAALDNALRLGDAALTGPVMRGDANTVASHLAVLQTTAPESVPAYRALARRTADRAISSGVLAASAAERLLEVLAEPAPAEVSEPA